MISLHVVTIHLLLNTTALILLMKFQEHFFFCKYWASGEQEKNKSHLYISLPKPSVLRKLKSILKIFIVSVSKPVNNYLFFKFTDEIVEGKRYCALHLERRLTLPDITENRSVAGLKSVTPGINPSITGKIEKLDF